MRTLNINLLAVALLLFGATSASAFVLDKVRCQIGQQRRVEIAICPVQAEHGVDRQVGGGIRNVQRPVQS